MTSQDAMHCSRAYHATDGEPFGEVPLINGWVWRYGTSRTKLIPIAKSAEPL
jgi:hypothetical protein